MHVNFKYWINKMKLVKLEQLGDQQVYGICNIPCKKSRVIHNGKGEGCHNYGKFDNQLHWMVVVVLDT